MIATAHVIISGAVGLAVGTVTENPVVALAAGAATHLICDGIPHLDGPLNPKYEHNHPDRVVWTRGLLTFALIDSIVAFLLTLFIWFKYFDLQFFAPYAWAALGGYLPDFIDLVPLWRERIQELPGFKQFHKFHVAIHDSWRFRFPMRTYWPLGIATQFITALPCLWYIVK